MSKNQTKPAHCPSCTSFRLECNPDAEDFDKPCDGFKPVRANASVYPHKVNVRISDAVKEALELIAGREEKSVSQIIREKLMGVTA